MSKGAAVSSCTRLLASASRRSAGRALRSILRSACGRGGRTRCTGLPSTAGKAVRQGACRRAISESAAARMGGAIGPRMRVAAVMLSPAPCGKSCSMNQ
jgi:hypothetical protein